VSVAAAGAAAGYLMTFGVTPTRPATEYGYIKIGDVLADAPKCAKVAKFVEKPNKDDAERLLAEGSHVWNSGMFMFRPQIFLSELARFEPAIESAARQAVEHAQRDLSFLRLSGDHFAKSPAISIDYAVMERTQRAATCPLTSDWSDLGSWTAIWDVAQRDADNNAVKGDVIMEDSRNCLVRSDGALTAVLGMEDTIVVTTADAVLVARRTCARWSIA